MATLRLTAHSPGGNSTVDISDTPLDRNHVMVEFIYGPDSIQRLSFTNTLNMGAVANLYLDEQCVPEHPFYLRWINRLGGWDYHMFECVQMFNRSTTDLIQFNPYLDTTESQGYTPGGILRDKVIIDMAPGETMEVGSDWQGKEEYDKLSLMIFSPNVQWWNERLQTWLGVILLRHSITRPTNIYRGEIGLEITLPDPIVQF